MNGRVYVFLALAGAVFALLFIGLVISEYRAYGELKKGRLAVEIIVGAAVGLLVASVIVATAFSG